MALTVGEINLRVAYDDSFIDLENLPWTEILKEYGFEAMVEVVD